MNSSVHIVLPFSAILIYSLWSHPEITGKPFLWFFPLPAFSTYIRPPYQCSLNNHVPHVTTAHKSTMTSHFLPYQKSQIIFKMKRRLEMLHSTLSFYKKETRNSERLRSQRFRTRSLGICLKPNSILSPMISHILEGKEVWFSRPSMIHPTPSGCLHDSKGTIYIIVYRFFFQGYHSYRNTFRFLRIQRVVTWGNTLLSVHFYLPLLHTQVRRQKALVVTSFPSASSRPKSLLSWELSESLISSMNSLHFFKVFFHMNHQLFLV